MDPRYQVQIANKVRGGRAVGTLWGVVDRGPDRNRTAWVFGPQASEELARTMAAIGNGLPTKETK